MPVYTVTVRTPDITTAQLKALIDALVANSLRIQLIQES